MSVNVYQRIRAKNIKNHINQSVCLVGRVQNVQDQKIVLDCGDSPINISNFKSDINDLKINDYLEVRGEAISENIFLLSDYNMIGPDFNLNNYNKSLELAIPAFEDYKVATN